MLKPLWSLIYIFSSVHFMKLAGYLWPSYVLGEFHCFSNWIEIVIKIVHCPSIFQSVLLTRLTWLIHTSVLPSNWNPDKMFPPTGLLGQVHMVKKIFLKFLHAGAIFLKFILLTSFEENHKFINKNDQLPAWRKIGNIFFTVCTWPNWPVGANILSGFQIEGKTYVRISQVRRVKCNN